MSEREQVSPSIRVFTFGNFRVERLSASPPEQPSAACYQPIAPEEWQKRNSARSLFKLLLSKPRRCLLRDLLLEQFWPEAEVSNATQYLNQAACALRAVMRTAEGVSLLTQVRTGDTSFYKLADQSRLWLDVDAIKAALEQADHLESTAGDALAVLEEAWKLAQGEFLAEDFYHEWAQPWRQEVLAMRRGLIHRLARLYIQRKCAYQAETLFLTLLHEDASDEDALVAVMTLLAGQGRQQEAWAVYQRTVKILQEEHGTQIGARTRTLAERIHHEPAMVELPLERQATVPLTPGPLISTKQASCLVVPASEISADGILVPPSLVTQGYRADAALAGGVTWLGIKLVHIIELVTHWNGQGMCYDYLQAVIHQEIDMFDSMKPHHISEEFTISRRQAIIAIAALPIALLMAVYQRQDSAIVIGEFLSRCAASLAACRHLINGRELGAVEQVLPQYLPTLVMLAQRPSPHQQAATKLVVQAYQLQSILALHGNNLAAMERYRREALKYSRLTGDHTLYVYALERLGGVFYQQKRSREVLETYQEVLPSLHEVPSQLRGIVYTSLAWAYGHSKQEQEALRYLGLAHEAYAADTGGNQTFLDVDLPLFYMHEGFTRLALHEHYPDRCHDQEAWKAFANVSGTSPSSVVPERIRLEAINYQTLTALALGNLEQFCGLLEQGANGARALGSQKRRQEAIDAYWKGRGQWPNEARVRDLADLFVN